MKLLFLLPLALLVFACAEPKEEVPAEEPKTEDTVIKEEKTDHTQSIAKIDGYRDVIENKIEELEKKEISLENSRAQVKQKWAAMHAYMMDDNIVRIKMYPHENISKRSEEFYYMDGELVLVFIEDEGSNKKGKDDSRMGKTYWFHNGELINEENKTGEQELTTQDADSERLLQEAKEFYEIAQNK